jgi:hypothetical protein
MQRSALAVSLACLASLTMTVAACSSGSPPKAAQAPAAPAARGGGPTVTDGDACPKICAASESCGGDDACQRKCSDWLITRGRPGIAAATATCAIGRIERACTREPDPRVAAVALVTCIDEAGRAALKGDRRALFVAARAICDRGARCGDGSKDDADECVQGMAEGERIPRGLGLFGAFKPEILADFRKCMDTTACTAENDVGCLGEMLGGARANLPSAEPSEGPGDENEPPKTKAAPTTPGGGTTM